MDTTDILAITEQGLNRASRELINKRLFDKSKITIIGKPSIINNGRLSALDVNSYVQYSSLDFSNANSIEVSTTAVYSKSEPSTFQCLWSLNDIETTKVTLSLVIYNNKLCLLSNENEIFTIEDEFKDNSEINVSVEITKNSYKVVLINNNERKVFEGNFSEVLDLSSYTQVQIGRTNTYPSNYWMNSMDLSTFIIKKDNILEYAPSTEPSFQFTKVLVSDGTIPLTDTSVPVLNHIYEFPEDQAAIEMSRTSSNVLLKITIGEHVHLTIAQVGLYIEGENGPELFALASGLSVKKEKNLGYELILNVNLNLGVVNTTVLPSILIADEDYVKLEDFTNIERIHTYIKTNMERIIYKNALALGYGRVIALIKNFMKSIILAQNCTTVQRYSKIKESIFPSVNKIFNTNKVNKQGYPEVTLDGDLKSMSSTSYCYSNNNVDFNKLENWEVEIGFELGLNRNEQTILDLYAPTNNHPLVVSLDSSNTCHATLGKLDDLVVKNNVTSSTEDFIRVPQEDFIVGENNFYGWETKNGSKIINYYVSIVGLLDNMNGVLSNFSTSNYALSNTKVKLDESTEVKVKFSLLSSSTVGQTIVCSNDNYGFLVEEKDGKLLYSFGNGTSWTQSRAVGASNIQPNVDYILNIYYVSGAIYCYVNDNLDYTSTVSAVPETFLKLGVNSQNTNPINGTIDLNDCYYKLNESVIWTGLISTSLIFSNSINPSKGSLLYDLKGNLFNNRTVSAVSSGVLTKQELFKPLVGMSYKVKVIFTGTEYDFYLMKDDENYKLLKRVVSSNKINSSTFQYFGVLFGEEIKNPFMGTIKLKEYSLVTPQEELDFVDKEVISTELVNHFSLYQYPYNYYKIYNLSNKEYFIEYHDGSILGNRDSVDFNNPLSSTLCVKFKIEDEIDKVILAKRNLSTNETYFSFEFVEKELLSTLKTSTSTIELRKSYKGEKLDGIVDNEMMLFITADIKQANPVISMYLNNDLVSSVVITNKDFIDPSNFVLTNYLKSPNEASKNYVSEILYFNGVLTEDDRYFVNNLMDTNF